MAGRTQLMADKSLLLYKGTTAIPVSGTWVSLFTTSPSADHPTAHLAVEWGPPRVQVHPDSGAGTPSWSSPVDKDAQTRIIFNEGSITWSSIVLTVSPSVVVSVGLFDASSAGSLLTWYPLVTPLTVADGGTFNFGTAQLEIRGE